MIKPLNIVSDSTDVPAAPKAQAEAKPEAVASGPAGNSSGVLSRYNFRNKAIKHLPVLEANLKQVTRGPVSVVIHPTNACNAKCPMCRYADLREENEKIPLQVLKTTIRDLASAGTKSIIISGGGEPLIYKGVDDVIRLAGSLGLKIGMVTNFIRVTDSILDAVTDHLDWIRISLNAASPEAYQIAQGMEPAVWPQLLENIRRLVQLRNKKRRKPIIGGSFIVQKGNYKDTGNFVDLCQDLGIDYVMYRPVQKWSQTASLSAGSLGLNKEELDETHGIIESKLKSLQGRKVIPHNLDKIMPLFFQFEEKKDYPTCYSTYVETALGGDGNIYPCCQHVGNTQFSGGNILEKPFLDLWTGDAHQNVRESINPSKCPPCRYNFYNTVFNRFVDGWRPTEEEFSLSSETEDVDFL